MPAPYRDRPAMVVTKPLSCLAAVLCITALAGAARAQDKPDNWLKRLFQPSATGSVPAAAAGTPEWSGQPGASGDPRMTVDAIREAAGAFGGCIEALWPGAAARGVR